MKRFFIVLFSVMLNAIIGATIFALLGFSPIIGAVILNLTAIVVPKLFKSPVGSLCAGVYTEVWTGQVVEHYTHAQEGTFLDGIPDFSDKAENSVIHLVDVSGDPSVLIDNTTYPLSLENLSDGDVAITLHKFETGLTRISDDELHAISYDKMKVAKERHGNKLAEGMIDKALHAFAPASDTNETPVLLTTGEDDGTGRKRLIREDVLALKRKLDKLKVPKRNRRLVLCSDHVSDLLELDQKFKDQYHNYETGVISKMYGFEIYEAVNAPLFNQSGTKLSYGAIAADGDYEASVFFYVPRMFKAKGKTKMYYSEAEKDPANKQNTLSFTTHFVALPQKREKAVGAIVSAAA